MDISQKILSEITIFNKYARYIPEMSRRETWQELCERNMAMHIRKYPNMKEEIKQIYKDFVLPKKVLPSMRSMQFGGNSIELSSNRMYNCAFMPIDHPDAFSENMFLLLGGCFKAGTLVKTSTGDKAIEDISINDLVLTFNEETKKFDWVNPKVAGKTMSAKKPKVKITLSDDKTIICTADHKFLTDNRGWVEAKDLLPTDDIISS